MENATKALIIAAAILIAIVLISLGVFVLGQGTTMVKENSDMTGTQVAAYNNEFEAYFGTKVSGSKVKSLVTAINQHNRNAEDDSKKISLTGNPTTLFSGSNDGSYATNSTSTGTFKVGGTYTVAINTSAAGTKSGYTTSGLIAAIVVTQNT